jgi:hypothetical protein
MHIYTKLPNTYYHTIPPKATSIRNFMHITQNFRLQVLSVADEKRETVHLPLPNLVLFFSLSGNEPQTDGPYSCAQKSRKNVQLITRLSP